MSDAPDIIARIDTANTSGYRQVITDALKALDEGRYGGLRRILTKGSDKGLMTETGVIAKDGAS